MSKNQTLHMRIDENLKADADALFSQLGITTADAINIFLKQALIHRGFPFEIKVPNYNEQTLMWLKEAVEISNKQNNNPCTN